MSFIALMAPEEGEEEYPMLHAGCLFDVYDSIQYGTGTWYLDLVPSPASELYLSMPGMAEYHLHERTITDAPDSDELYTGCRLLPFTRYTPVFDLYRVLGPYRIWNEVEGAEEVFIDIMDKYDHTKENAQAAFFLCNFAEFSVNGPLLTTCGWHQSTFSGVETEYIDENGLRQIVSYLDPEFYSMHADDRYIGEGERLAILREDVFDALEGGWPSLPEEGITVEVETMPLVLAYLADCRQAIENYKEESQ